MQASIDLHLITHLLNINLVLAMLIDSLKHRKPTVNGLAMIYLQEKRKELLDLDMVEDNL